MGTICILLGIIFLIAFVLGGVFCANGISAAVAGLGQWFLKNHLTGIAEDLSNIDIPPVIIIGIFSFFGLLICLNLVMHGLTYNKVRKLSRRRHHQ